jgi:hypothetical protein
MQNVTKTCRVCWAEELEFLVKAVFSGPSEIKYKMIQKIKVAIATTSKFIRSR